MADLLETLIISLFPVYCGSQASVMLKTLPGDKSPLDSSLLDQTVFRHYVRAYSFIRASVDALYRDDTGEILRNPCTK